MDKKEYLKKLQEVYELYNDNGLAIDDGGALFSNDKRDIYTLRSHARGVQNTSKYADQLDPVQKDSTGKLAKKRQWGISWEPVKILSKFRTLAIEKITDLILIPNTEAIDDTARIAKKNKENRMKLIRNPNTQMVKKMDDGNPEIETVEDVDFISKMGGIRLAVEIMMKDGIDATLYQSNYEVVARMLAEDIIDVNAFATHQEPINGMEKIHYVDVARMVVRPSIHPDFRDSDFRGFIKNEKSSEILMSHDFSPEDEKTIEGLDKNNTRSSNIYDSYNGHREYFSDYQSRESGPEVMTLYFLEKVTETFIDGKTKENVQQFERVESDFNLTKRMEKQGKKLKKVSRFVLHKCKWLIKTNIVYDFGEVDYIVREGEEGRRSVLWPITIYAGHEPSLVSGCIAFDDDLQIANYTLRNIYTKIPPGPRMVIYKDQLKDGITIAGEDYTILDMITKYQSEGIMVLERNSDFHEPGDPAQIQKTPIEFLPSGVSEDIPMLRQRILDNIDLIRQVTGINEVADGTSQNPDMLKSVMEGLSSATNTALKPYVKLYINGFKTMIKYTALKYQEMVVSGDIDLGYLPISEEWTKHVKLTSSVHPYDWGIMVDVITKESRDMLIMDLQQRKDQIPGDAYFKVWNIIQAGDLKKAQYILAKYIAKAAESAHERQLEVAQATAKANQEAAVATEQAKSNTVQLEGQSRLESIRLQGEIDAQKAIADHLRQLEIIKKQDELLTVRELSVVEANNRNRLEQ